MIAASAFGGDPTAMDLSPTKGATHVQSYKSSVLRTVTALAVALAMGWATPIQTVQAQQRPAAQSAQPPNILVLWGDDIGTWNISHNNRGMMGYQTPNIDRIAREGVGFTDYYGQQSCTAGRAAFIGGTVPVRTGMTKVGLPGAKEGWQASDPTIAALLKDKGYATAQFGKNHFGDRDEHLPTAHGFDEYFGSLYHLNASEEPENLDYPKDPEFAKKFGPRGVIKSTAGGTITDTGPLTKKRMETIDDETSAAALDFIDRQVKANKPFFCWWNGTRMHFRTHVKAENRGKSGQDEYADGMVEHDVHIGLFLKKLDDLGIANNTIVFYSTDNGPHYNAWPDAGTTQFRSEKNSNWEGAYRVPAFVRWPGHFPAGTTLNGLVAHEDWMPTFLAAAGMPDVKERLMKGDTFAGRKYRAHPDGYNMLDYLSGKTKVSPAMSFGTLMTTVRSSPPVIRTGRLCSSRTVARLSAFGESHSYELRVPLLFNLRRDPFEKSQHNSNTYNDWFLDRAFVLVPIQGLASKFLLTMKDYPPSQTPGSFNLSKIEEQLRRGGGGD